MLTKLDIKNIAAGQHLTPTTSGSIGGSLNFTSGKILSVSWVCLSNHDGIACARVATERKNGGRLIGTIYEGCALKVS